MTPERYKKLQTLCDELTVEFLGSADPYCQKLTSLKAQLAVIEMLVTLKDVDPICEECGHRVVEHFDPYGCQHERGDSYESGYAPMASGPCGCTAWTIELAERRQP